MLFAVNCNLMSQVASSAPPARRVNLRTPEVMEAVQAAVEAHYFSPLVEKLRRVGGGVKFGDVTIRLAKQFGFCYGVERAIDLAYAARKVFADRTLYLIGEIIHNPDVNAQLSSMGIRYLKGRGETLDLSSVGPEDVVIIPAFGAEVALQERLKNIGCQVVDTTCGDVMSVWKRVRQNSRDEATSIIHGKAEHEETRATSSHAVGDGSGHYLVVLNLEETDYVCQYIVNGGDRQEFLGKFKGAMSEGFNPDVHLKRVGVANQTTMMRGETEEVQRRIYEAIRQRDGDEEKAKENYRFFDTICGATQERQNALEMMLKEPMDLLLVVGGYNSSNTSHLAEMGEVVLPTYFIRNATRMDSAENITHYNLHQKQEIQTKNWFPKLPVIVGVTAGASCPNNLIEETILRVFELGGVDRDDVLRSTGIQTD